MHDILPGHTITIKQSELGEYLNWLADAYGTPGIELQVTKTQDPQLLQVSFLKHYQPRDRTAATSDLPTARWVKKQ